MKYKLWIPAHGETVDDAREQEADDAREAAEWRADREYHNSEGWEWTWPTTYHVRDEQGATVAVEVEMEFDPVFSAGRAESLP